MSNRKVNCVKSPVRFSAEIWDQMQFFFKEYNDHQLHAVIYFENIIDRELIKKAVILSTEIVPILKSRFVVNKVHPYWEIVEDFNNYEIVSFVESTNLDEEVQSFITCITNELTGPQLKIRVIRTSNKDTLCIVMNHMVCDGAGFKEYLYLLSDIYMSLKNGINGKVKYSNGSRNSKQIYKQFNVMDKIKIFCLPNKPTKNKNNIRFPLSNKKEGIKPFILTYSLEKDRFDLLKKYCKKHSVTINDVILAAYYRVLYKMLELNEEDNLTIPCMVDLRRYLPNKKANGICNLASMIMCNIGFPIGKSFDETVKMVNTEMNNNKNGYAGLHGLSVLNILFKSLPFITVKKLIKQNFVNPMIGMTNIGIIDSSRLVFGSTAIKNAFVCGSIKYPPYFQLALTSFNNSITFSVNLYGSKKDMDLVHKFFNFLNNELKNIII